MARRLLRRGGRRERRLRGDAAADGGQLRARSGQVAARRRREVELDRAGGVHRQAGHAGHGDRGRLRGRSRPTAQGRGKVGVAACSRGEVGAAACSRGEVHPATRRGGKVRGDGGKVEVELVDLRSLVARRRLLALHGIVLDLEVIAELASRRRRGGRGDRAAQRGGRGDRASRRGGRGDRAARRGSLGGRRAPLARREARRDDRQVATRRAGRAQRGSRRATARRAPVSRKRAAASEASPGSPAETRAAPQAPRAR